MLVMIWIILAGLLIVFGLWWFTGAEWRGMDGDLRSLKSESTVIQNVESKKDADSSKFKIPQIRFKSSGWVLFYQIGAWLVLVCGIIIFCRGMASDYKDIKSAATDYFIYALIGSLSCFFAAHVLRLQEKTAHHAERTANAIERLEKKTKEE